MSEKVNLVIENGKLFGGEEQKNEDLKLNMDAKLQYYLQEMKDKYKTFADNIAV